MMTKYSCVRDGEGRDRSWHWGLPAQCPLQGSKVWKKWWSWGDSAEHPKDPPCLPGILLFTLEIISSHIEFQANRGLFLLHGVLRDPTATARSRESKNWPTLSFNVYLINYVLKSLAVITSGAKRWTEYKVSLSLCKQMPLVSPI